MIAFAFLAAGFLALFLGERFSLYLVYAGLLSILFAVLIVLTQPVT
jgi:hypothetical protein